MEQLKRSLCNLLIVDIMLELGHRQCFKTVELQSYEQSSSSKFFILKKIRETNAQNLEEVLANSFPQVSDHLEPVKGVKTDGQCHHSLELTDSSQLPGSNLIFRKLIAETKRTYFLSQGLSCSLG